MVNHLTGAQAVYEAMDRISHEIIMRSRHRLENKEKLKFFLDLVSANQKRIYEFGAIAIKMFIVGIITALEDGKPKETDPFHEPSISDRSWESLITGLQNIKQKSLRSDAKVVVLPILNDSMREGSDLFVPPLPDANQEVNQELAASPTFQDDFDTLILNFRMKQCLASIRALYGLEGEEQKEACQKCLEFIEEHFQQGIHDVQRRFLSSFFIQSDDKERGFLSSFFDKSNGTFQLKSQEEAESLVQNRRDLSSVARTIKITDRYLKTVYTEVFGNDLPMPWLPLNIQHEEAAAGGGILLADEDQEAPVVGRRSISPQKRDANNQDRRPLLPPKAGTKVFDVRRYNEGEDINVPPVAFPSQDSSQEGKEQQEEKTQSQPQQEPIQKEARREEEKTQSQPQQEPIQKEARREEDQQFANDDPIEDSSDDEEAEFVHNPRYPKRSRHVTNKFGRDEFVESTPTKKTTPIKKTKIAVAVGNTKVSSANKAKKRPDIEEKLSFEGSDDESKENSQETPRKRKAAKSPTSTPGSKKSRGRLRLATPNQKFEVPKPGKGSSSSSPPKYPKKRRVKRAWTAEETDALKEGVKKHGVGNWARVKEQFAKELRYRTNVQLKDRWRVLVKNFEV